MECILVDPIVIFSGNLAFFGLGLSIGTLVTTIAALKIMENLRVRLSSYITDNSEASE